jgi:hypothetical protein
MAAFAKRDAWGAEAPQPAGCHATGRDLNNQCNRLAGGVPTPDGLRSLWRRGFPLGVGPQGLQIHACHVAARWALVPDQARLICQRHNPHHLVH